MSKKSIQHLSLACFVSSHGFGHASRVAAVIHSLSLKVEKIDLCIFGDTPAWFWKANLPTHGCSHSLFPLQTDVGLIQKSPFEHDLEQTYRQVLDFLTFSSPEIDSARTTLKKLQPQLALCDISPLGINLSKELGIPVILQENFTWDWIYKEYENKISGFSEIRNSLSQIYAKVDLRVHCSPCCHPTPLWPEVNPIFRPPTLSPLETKKRLGLGASEEFALVTTGGIPMNHLAPQNSEIVLLIPGNFRELKREGKILYLPMNCGVPFTSLVNAACLVVGKAGYGTISECWGTDTPFLAVFRDSFRESDILRKYCEENLFSKEIPLETFIDGSWLELARQLKSAKKKALTSENGSGQVAELILEFHQKIL